MNKKSYIIFIVLFLMICIFPLCTMPVYSTNESVEKRTMKKMPHIREEGKINKEFLVEFTDYFNENFGFRQEMAGMNAAIMKNIFFTSSEKNVVVGSDGWLYYGETTDNYCGLNRMNERQIHNCSRVLYIMQQYVKDKGGKFLFTIAPNKNSLYDENMPYYYRKSTDESNYDAMFHQLEVDEVNAVDLKKIFLNDDRILYHKLDTHWNNQGAALAHSAMLKAFGVDGVDFDNVHYYSIKNFTGDLYQMLYPNGQDRDINIVYDYYFHFNYKGENVTTDMMKFESWNESAQGNLLMLRDSFGNALAPFMSEEFAHCTFTKAVPYNLFEMEKQPYDYVAIEIAERHLQQLQEGIPVMSAQELEYCPEYTRDKANDVTMNVEERADLGLVKLYGYVDPDFTDNSSNIYVQIVSESGVHIYEAFPAVDDVRENQSKNDYGYGVYIPQSMYKEAGTKVEIITEKDGRVYADEKSVG